MHIEYRNYSVSWFEAVGEGEKIRKIRKSIATIFAFCEVHFTNVVSTPYHIF